MLDIDPRHSAFVPIKSRGDLPHLYKPDAIYFVTFRMADALIPSGQGRSSSEHIEDDIEGFLQNRVPPLTSGSCALNRRDIAVVVQNAILHFEGTRYLLGSWSIMPNHVHVIFSPLNDHGPAGVLQSWKGFTAREANRILGKRGTFWERESFDHLIRSPRGLEKFSCYVEVNAVRAGLCMRPSEWEFSSAGSGFKSAFWRNRC